MKIIGLDHIGIRISDFKRSLDFYQQLGFISVREDYNEHVFVIQHPSGITLNLLDSSEQHDLSNILMDNDLHYAGYTHYAIEVMPIDEAVQFIQSLNIEITEGPVTFGDGNTSIFIRDPDRNVIEFTQAPKH